MRRRRLRNFIMGFRLDRMDEIGKLHRVLDEEHGNVVADQIVVAFLGIKLDGETARHPAPSPTNHASPTTVEKRTKTGVFTDGSCRNLAFV